MDFAKLKKGRKSNLADLQKKMEETAVGKKTYQRDERYWRPTTDKEGNGSAVIRFIPPQKGDTEWVRLWHHYFRNQVNGQWRYYSENSLTTLEQDDPVGEFNAELWNTGEEDKKKQASAQKRKLSFISNILVVKDPGNPDNEGKVFLYKYGKKIFTMMNDVMNPEFEDEDPIDPFNMWEGANFRLSVMRQSGFPNYDKSSFAKPSPVAKTDDEIEAIFKQTHDIQAEVAPDKFKSYDELKKKLEWVLNLQAVRQEVGREEPTMEAEDESPFRDEPQGKTMESADPLEGDDDDDIDSLLDSLTKKP